MQTCTECGTAISPAIGPPVLKDGNVVCQPCWQKDEARTGGVASRVQPRAGSVTRRTAGAAASSSRRPSTSATPASRRSSGRAEAPAPADRGAARRPSGETSPHRPPSRTAALIEEVESSTSGDRIKIYIWVTMVVFVIAAAIVGWMWNSKTTRDKIEAERSIKEAEAAKAHVESVLKQYPNDFAKQKQAIEEAKEKVKPFSDKKSWLSSVESDVIGNEQKSQSASANNALIEELEKEVEDPAKRQAVGVKLGRARVVQNAMGKEYAERVTKVEQKLLLYTLKDGVDAAKAKEAAGDLAGALAAYDEAVQKFNKEFDKNQGKPPTPDILNLYKELIAESDKVVERVETPEFEAQVPERDMLSPKERGAWGKSAGAEMNFAARELELKGVAVEGKKILGVVSFAGWNPPWQDVVLDLNFTIISGEFQLYTRYWPDKRSYMLEFGPKQGYELNKPYQITIKIKGSKFEMMQPDQPPQMDLMKENTSRTGGVGFAVPPGTKVILSSCKVKVLRPK